MAKNWLDQARELLTSLQSKGTNFVQQNPTPASFVQQQFKPQINQATNYIKQQAPIVASNIVNKTIPAVWNSWSSGPKQLGSGIGSAINAPMDFLRNNSMVNTQNIQANKNLDLAQKLMDQGKFNLANNLISKTSQQQKLLNTPLQQTQNAQNVGLRNIAVGLPRTALTVAGTASMLKPVNVAISGAIGAGAGLLTKQNPFTEAGKAIGGSAELLGLSNNITSPLAYAVSGNLKGKVGSALFKQIIGRAITGTSALGENEIISKLNNVIPGTSDRLVSFVLGAALSSGGTVKDWENAKGNLFKTIAKAGELAGLDARPVSEAYPGKIGNEMPKFLYDFLGDKKLQKQIKDTLKDNRGFIDINEIKNALTGKKSPTVPQKTESILPEQTNIEEGQLNGKDISSSNEKLMAPEQKIPELSKLPLLEAQDRPLINQGVPNNISTNPSNSIPGQSSLTNSIPQETKLLPAGGESSSPINKIINALKGAKPLRGEQEALYSQERAKRVAAISNIGKNLGGEQGYFQQLGALKGELPKVSFESIRKSISQPDIDNLFNTIEKSNIITPFEKITAKSGLAKLLGAEGGVVPTEGELKLLGEIYPKEFIDAVLSKRPLIQKLFAEGQDALNIPRAIMATGDFSAPLRQGIFLGPSHPKEFASAFGNMFKYAFNEKAYDGLKESIQSSPNYLVKREAKLAMTDMSSFLNNREETFMSKLVEKIPGVGTIVKGSERAYNGFLNKLRSDVFDNIYETAKKSGVKVDPKFAGDLAKFINSATGRGDLGALQKAAPILNATLFSPRLIASRVNLLNPVYYAKLNPTIRKEALKSLFTFAGTGMAVLTLAKLGGAEVGIDPRSADFGKIKIGNTRFDIWGGFQQYIRLAAQLITNQRVNSATGVVSNFGEGYKPTTRLDLLTNFAESKEAPFASFITGLLKGQSFGEKFDIKSEVTKRFIPLVAQDMAQLVQEKGLAGVAMGTPGIFGVGTQTYSQTPKDVVSSFNSLDLKIKSLIKQGDKQEALRLLKINQNIIRQGVQLKPIYTDINKLVKLQNQAKIDKRLTPQQKQQLVNILDKKIKSLQDVADKKYQQIK